MKGMKNMSISSINSYAQNIYATGSTNSSQSTQESSNTTKVRGGHHHHHNKNGSQTSSTTANSTNIQTNGTDTIELSSAAQKTLSASGQADSNTNSNSSN